MKIQQVTHSLTATDGQATELTWSPSRRYFFTL